MLAVPVSAESLQQALASTYRYSAIIDAQRARLRATDENVSQANAGFRPRVNAHGEIAWEHTINSQDGGPALSVGPGGQLTLGGANRTSGYGFSLSQPLFTGGHLTYQLRTAEATVRAGRESLRDVVRSVFLSAVTAYTDVIATQEILKLQERNLDTLNKLVKSTKDRLAYKELTQTDVAQAEARRAVGLSALDSARANAKTARATYLQIIGNEPSNITEPPLPRKLLPKSLAEAQAIAARENPLIVNALYIEEAARHQVDQVRSQLLPTVSLDARWDDRYSSQGSNYQRSGEVAGRLSVPLYEGGAIYSQVRQAKETHLSTIQSLEVVRAQTEQAVVAAWQQMEAARARVEHNMLAIKANQSALEGVTNEEAIGQRTFLDILNAEQELLFAKVAYATARTSHVVAAYTLLAQIGRLDADHLELVGEIYDPTKHYDEVRRKWFGLSITHADGRREFVDAVGAPGETGSK